MDWKPPVAWLAAGLLATAVEARELAVDEDSLVSVEVASVGIVRGAGAPVVLLRDPEDGTVVPIFIGPNEARAILRALRGEATPRPMTHDLLAATLSGLDAELSGVVVDALHDKVFHGALLLRDADGAQHIIDARPSDAIALAARSGARVRIAPEVLAAAGQTDWQSLGEEDIASALGITVVVATPELREAMELGDAEGVLVSHVRGPAADAGMTAGVLITAIDDTPPESPQHFLRLIRKSDGEQLRLRYQQGGETQHLELPTDLQLPPAAPVRSEENRPL